MNPITVNYRDHTITYNVEGNTWECDAFTNRQGSPSLLLAQGRIDKLLDPPANKPKFQKVMAWKRGRWNDGWQRITITSKAEDGCFATIGKDRCKLRTYDLDRVYEDTPANVARIEEIKEHESKREHISQMIADAEKQLTRVKL
jgi:hypothetical protein